MKKHLFFFFAIFGLFLTSFARPVDLQTAQSVASKFMETNDLQLVSTYPADKHTAAFYVFNTTDGFVIVAADDCETPIIAYSHEGLFDPNNVPVQMEEFLNDFAAKIQYGIENHIEADELTARQWDLVKATGRLNEQKAAKSVAPLLTSKWHQGCRYNSLCPTMAGPCDRAEAGCVAVAMGQIMRYWRYPETGWGSHSYSNSGIQLSADFGNTTYDWHHMPDSLNENSSEAEITAIGTLLYHCGVSVDMKYNQNGSVASSGDVPSALYHYFSYSKQVHREKRANYDDETWLSMLKHDLDLQRPVLYSGSGDQGAHAFVCDGYDDNNMLHFNWGWGIADGYFALGNLNPNGYEFNKNHFAVFDIIPQYEPCVVTATAYPPSAGTIEGTGEYHFGDNCTLIAVPNGNCKFEYWKKDGSIVSYDTSYDIVVRDDVDNIEAFFSYMPVKQITATHAPDTNNVNSPYVSLSWNYEDHQEWPLLKQFEINGEKGVTTDGEYIYTYEKNNTFTFGKYTLDGDLVELFDIAGAKPDGMTCDGNYFYCSRNTAAYDIGYLYRYDFTNKTLVDSMLMWNWQCSKCAYDVHHDGFWIKDLTGRNLALVNRQGQTINAGLILSTSLSYSISGFGSITAEDGNPHLLLISTGKSVYDYDISNNSFNEHPILSLSIDNVHFIGASIGKYEGKDALFLITENYLNDNSRLHIYEINSHLSSIMHYRLYRADNEGYTITLADEYTGTSYIDSTWNDANAGMYRFGISEVYYNGVESEIIWSESIEKTDYGIEESLDDTTNPTVQKVFEDGHIVIIKDGKRYTMTGQQLN